MTVTHTLARPRSRVAALALLALALAVGACSAIPGLPGAAAPFQPTSGMIGRDTLDAAVAAWATQHDGDYRWEVSFSCECLLNGPVSVTVEDGAPTLAVKDGAPIDLDQAAGFPLTIEALFADAYATLEGGGTVTAAFDATGAPRSMRLDRDVQAIDDELDVEVLAVAVP